MDFANQPRSHQDCINRYGHIDFASRHWPNAGLWVKSLVVPPGMFPNWHVMNTRLPVHAISCNLDIHPYLLRALNAIKAGGMSDLLKTFDGCFNIRPIRNSSSFSAHSYGLALDLNASHNPMGAVLHTDMKAAFVKCFTDQGFTWGGSFHGRKDPMHFSWCGF
jgi:hypothetical protein